ncbi:MAG: Cro/C1-type helix-turn-helix domain protein [Caudoviricetes sp.]|nr:MAG: Cro/C1-type helix-turn-helix domain protein [Caudoviricetes sp.]
MSELNKWAKAKHGRVAQIAKCLSITPEYASNLVCGKYNLTAENTMKLVKLTGLSLKELNPELAEMIGEQV